MSTDSTTPTPSRPTKLETSFSTHLSRHLIKPSTFIKRLLSWVILWLVALTLIYSGWQTGWCLLVALFALLGQWEFYHAQEDKGHKVFKQSGLFCGALLFFNSWYFLVFDPARAALEPIGQELVLVIVTLGAFIRLVVWQEVHRAPITTAALTLLGFLYVPLLFNFVAVLALQPGSINENRFLLIYLLAVTKFSDVGAYVIGSMIGRHKMIPRISPGKSWEGFIGGILTSLGLSVGLVLFQGQGDNPLTLVDAIILGVLLPLTSVVGDLAESVVKRDASIKDSGQTIPGIGGALDLIDSILFTAPVLYFYLQFVSITHVRFY